MKPQEGIVFVSSRRTAITGSTCVLAASRAKCPSAQSIFVSLERASAQVLPRWVHFFVAVGAGNEFTRSTGSRSAKDLPPHYRAPVTQLH
jgi:hypothetical protein